MRLRSILGSLASTSHVLIFCCSTALSGGRADFDLFCSLRATAYLRGRSWVKFSWPVRIVEHLDLEVYLRTSWIRAEGVTASNVRPMRLEVCISCQKQMGMAAPGMMALQTR